MLIAKITLHPHSFKKQLTDKGEDVYPEEVRPYLGPSEGTDPKSAQLIALASELNAKTTVETVTNILAWMKKNTLSH